MFFYNDLKVLALVFSTMSLGLFASEIEQGKARFAACMVCHGPAGEGNASLMAPALAGQEPWYIKAQIHKFKNDQRGADYRDLTGMQMKGMAMSLRTDKDIDELLAYIKTFPKPPKKATLNGDPTKGKIAYALCSSCHGPEAKGNPALKAPALVNLPDWYIVAQLKKFNEGIRGVHPKDQEGQLMRTMAATVPDEAARRDLAAYIISLE